MNRQQNSSKMPAELVARLRQFAGRSEAEGVLTAEQLNIIYDNRWFKLFVPSSLGGLELSLPAGVRLEEELARIDGSLGWTVTLCAGANLFVGYMDRSVAELIFTDPKVCFGGSGHATGKAVVKGDRYVVSGKWRYATGAPHLTHFTVNCVVEQDGKELLDNKGNPVVRSFFFPKADVGIIDDWNTFGLKATASYSFEVDHLLTNRSQTFLINPQTATWDHPIYQYPFLQFAEATLAANTLGMARHFLTCATDLGISGLQKLVQAAELELMEIRESFHKALDTSWHALLHKDNPLSEALDAVSERSRTLVKVSREQVVALYPHVGLVGADASSEINRVWRDIFTASQHSLLRL